MPLIKPENTVTLGSAIGPVIGTVVSHGYADSGAEDSIDKFIALEAEAEATRHGFAHVIHESLMRRITTFEATLKPDEEIGAYLASFGAQTLIHVERVGCSHPFLISFIGHDLDNRRVELVQHTTQLNVLFVAVPVEPPRKPRRIGFHVDEKPAGNA